MLDFGKPVRTLHGNPVVILCTNAPGPYPVVGYYWTADTVGAVMWSVDGVAWNETDPDIENYEPPKYEYLWWDLADQERYFWVSEVVPNDWETMPGVGLWKHKFSGRRRVIVE